MSWNCLAISIQHQSLSLSLSYSLGWNFLIFCFYSTSFISVCYLIPSSSLSHLSSMHVWSPWSGLQSLTCNDWSTSIFYCWASNILGQTHHESTLGFSHPLLFHNMATRQPSLQFSARGCMLYTQLLGSVITARSWSVVCNHCLLSSLHSISKDPPSPPRVASAPKGLLKIPQIWFALLGFVIIDQVWLMIFCLELWSSVLAKSMNLYACIICMFDLLAWSMCVVWVHDLCESAWVI